MRLIHEIPRSFAPQELAPSVTAPLPPPSAQALALFYPPRTQHPTQTAATTTTITARLSQWWSVVRRATVLTGVIALGLQGAFFASHKEAAALGPYAPGYYPPANSGFIPPPPAPYGYGGGGGGYGGSPYMGGGMPYNSGGGGGMGMGMGMMGGQTVDCSHSKKIGKDHDCSWVNGVNMGAQGANIVGQMAGSATNTSLGNQAMINASNNGTQNSALQEAANLQIKSGDNQIALGTTNMAIAIAQAYYKTWTNRHATEIGDGSQKSQFAGTTAGDVGTSNYSQDGARGQVTGKHTVATAILEKFELNHENTVEVVGNKKIAAKRLLERDKKDKEHEQNVRNSAQEIGQNAVGEQNAAGAALMAGAFMTAASGVGEMINGNMARAGGKATLNGLKASQAAASAGTIITPPTASNLSNSSSQGPSSPMTISSSGLINPNGGALNNPNASGSSLPALPPNLSSNIGPNTMPSYEPGPTPSSMAVGPATGNADGGMYGGSGAATSPDYGPPQGPNQPSLVSDQGASYSSSGGGVMASGGGGSGAKGAEAAPDFAGMLSKFLPQNTPDPRPGILAYGQPGPNQNDGSILGQQGPTLFERVSSNLENQEKAGKVGL